MAKRRYPSSPDRWGDEEHEMYLTTTDGYAHSDADLQQRFHDAFINRGRDPSRADRRRDYKAHLYSRFGVDLNLTTFDWEMWKVYHGYRTD